MTRHDRDDLLDGVSKRNLEVAFGHVVVAVAALRIVVASGIAIFSSGPAGTRKIRQHVSRGLAARRPDYPGLDADSQRLRCFDADQTRDVIGGSDALSYAALQLSAPSVSRITWPSPVNVGW